MATTSSSEVRLLEEAAELGAAAFAGMPGSGFLIVDPEFRILLAAGHAVRDEVRSGVRTRRLVEVVPATAWAILRPRYEAALAGEAQTFAYTAPHDGATYQVRLAPLWNDGVIMGVTVLTQDTTSQTEAARNLAEMDRRRVAVSEALEEGLILIDRAGGILNANPAAGRILGIELRPSLAQPQWWIPLAARTPNGGGLLGAGAEVLRSGTPIRNVRIEIDGPEQRAVQLSANYSPLRDEAGAVTGLVLSFRDVTQQVEEHRRIVALSERLQEAHEIARLASWEWDPVTNDVTVFQAMADSHVWSGVSASFEELFRMLPVTERANLRAALGGLVNGETNLFTRRHLYELPTGSAWLETRARAIRDSDGALMRVRGTTQDVTEQEAASQQVEDSRDFLQATLDSLPVQVAVLDGTAQILMVNREWAQFAPDYAPGLRRVDPQYFQVSGAAEPDAVATRAAAGLRSILCGADREFILEYRCHGDGSERWYELRATQFTGPGQARVVVAHEDVTERRLAQAEVIKQAALLEILDVAVVACDLDLRVTYWNRGAELISGWTRDEAIGRRYHEVTPLLDAERSRVARQELDRTGSWNGELWVYRRDGSTYPAHFEFKLLVDAVGEPTGIITAATDISERVNAQRELASARNHLQTVTDSIGEGLFTLDADGRVTYMNHAAERLLGWLSADLLGRVMHDITHTHRADGSHFPIEECPILDARRAGRTVRVEDDIFITRSGTRLPVAYTSAPFTTEDGVEGCVVVFEDISERKARQDKLQSEAGKLEWIERIVDTLAEDRFELYAQPIIEPQTRRIVQRELLLRMRTREGEVIAPGEFLPIAEEYGLIGDIDRWVVERAVALAARGEAVELNLSAISVSDPRMIDHIEQCLRRFGARPELIVFEITETALINDERAAYAFASRLRSLGVKLALDDFGTGYGSFSYLKQFPIDYLKIDIEFVRDLTTSQSSRHLVENIVSLAHAFELQTVAEGIEDEATLELVHHLGVDFAQGYHIGKPTPLAPSGPDPQ